MKSAIEKQYNEIRKKQSLPDFNEINSFLEIENIEETSFLTKVIVERIGEKIESYTSLLQETIQPEASSLSSMHEAALFDEDERKKLYDLYMRLMASSRGASLCLIKNDEGFNSKFICYFMGEWKELGAQLENFITKLRDSWKTESSIEEKQGYMG